MRSSRAVRMIIRAPNGMANSSVHNDPSRMGTPSAAAVAPCPEHVQGRGELPRPAEAHIQRSHKRYQEILPNQPKPTHQLIPVLHFRGFAALSHCFKAARQAEE